MKRKIAFLIAFVLLTACLLSACSPLGGYRTIVRETQRQEYETEDVQLFKRTEGPPQKTIQYIEMDGQSYQDLFLATAFQGLVNREQPFMWVIHDEIVEGQGSFASQYWFDKLDETYTGEDSFEKEEKTDLYAMIEENLESIKGYVLYHERLCDAEMVSRYKSNTIYSDIAVLNLTVMMCGQYDAIPLTAAQRDTLFNDYGVELEKLGDTTQFMRDEQGNIIENRASKEIWNDVYTYALKKFGDSVCDDALMHNPGFQPAHFDFAVAHKMFVFNRIMDSDSTSSEQAMVRRIYNLTKSNTLVHGCWYLQMDEAGFMAECALNGKAFVGTYESYNLTWTSALPEEEFPEKDETKIELDENKVYVAFDFSEGDFNSYVQFKMKGVYDDEGRGTVPISISVQPTLTESNPNIVRYFRENWADGDNFVMAEAGIGYMPTPPEPAAEDEFFALTQEYMERNDMDCIRMLSPDQDDPLRYAEKLDGLSAMMLGYMGEQNEMVNNNEEANFLYRDTVFFDHYFCDQIDMIKQYKDPAPGFFSISMAGWNYLPSTIAKMMEGFDERFEVVTTTQLADLYKQYYGGEFKDITSADFDAGFNRKEMGFLWYASDHKAYDKLAGSRYAEDGGWFVYKFDLDDDAQRMMLNASVYGDYQIEVSTDYREWYVIDSGLSNYEVNKNYDLSEFTGRNEDNTVYVRFQSKESSSLEVYGVRISTDLETLQNGTLEQGSDANYLDGSASEGENGRPGTFTYKLPFEEDTDRIDIAFRADGDKTLSYSQDGKNFTKLALSGSESDRFARLDIGSWQDKTVWLRFEGEGEVECVKFNSEDAVRTGIVLSPNGLTSESKYLIGTSETEIASGQIYTRRISGTDGIVYKFRLDPTIQDLTLYAGISGQFRVQASPDNKTYTDVLVAELGELYDPVLQADVRGSVSSDGYLYLKFSSLSEGRTASLSSLILLSDKSTDELRSVIESSRTEDIVIKPVMGGGGIESELLFEDNGSTIFLGYGYARVADTNASFVYKLDFSAENADFWKQIYPEFDAAGLKRVRIGFDVCNNYKISVSADGINYTILADADDPTVHDGSNRKTVYYTLEDIAENACVYVKFEDSYKLDAGWGTILYGTYFYFN